MNYVNNKIKKVIFALFIFSVLMTGCSKNNQESKGEVNQNQRQAQENQMPSWDESFEPASLNDLETGQRVLVMGTENSDGSVSANQIMIGESETDFENMAGAMRPQMDNNSNNQIDNQPIQPPDFAGQRPDFDQMQNMSEEDRIKFMEEMRAQRQASGVRRTGNMGQGVTRLVGQIINKDESTITLKLDDGGSKLVFYSDETTVMIRKQSS